jgi:hypothetical protein
MSRVQPLTQTADQACPVSAVSFFSDRVGAQGSLTDRGCPVEPDLTCGIDRHDLEHRAVLVDGHESFAAFAADLDLEPRNTAQGALLVVRKDSFDEWMPEAKKSMVSFSTASSRSNVPR